MRRKILLNYNLHKSPAQKLNKMIFTTRTTTTSATQGSANTGSWRSYMLTAISLLMLLLVRNCECSHDDLPAISQISPKSSSYLDVNHVSYLSASRLTLESTMPDDDSNSTPNYIGHAPQPQRSINHEENETRQMSHLRVERSALPILNEGHFPKSGPNDVHFASEQQKEAAAGRYFQYNIKPTGTYDALLSSENPESTKRVRAGKTLQPEATAVVSATSQAPTAGSSFLLKGGLRPFTSGSPISAINPTSSIATSTAASASTLTPHNARQNSNPDIQDIITGIVKLLNGNVNVHANTQGIRRPSASRINNRGPPRISETQTLPLDYDTQNHNNVNNNMSPLGTSNRPPPPYPFDRPERPFITGVPIPEQIVPYRPGFVSNRPPWHRNKPRPPITTTVGGRRPITQYKPLPASQMSPPALVQDSEQPQLPQTLQEQQPPPLPPTQQSDDATGTDYNETLDTAKPTDTTYDSEFSNEDTNTQYIEVSDQDNGDTVALGGGTGTVVNQEGFGLPAEIVPPLPSPNKEKEHSTKKKSNKHKASDKKKHSVSSHSLSSSPVEYTTIIETSSAVHTVVQMSSTYLPMPMESGFENVNVDSSTEEVIFMTPSKTPALETAAIASKSSSSKSKTQITSDWTTGVPAHTTSSTVSSISTLPLVNAEVVDLSTELKATISPTPSSSAPIPSSTTIPTTTTTTTTTETSTTTTTTNAYHPTQTPPTTAPSQYHPRPGIVLDDPEFKPGGRPRPQRPPQQQQPARPPMPQHPPMNIQPTRQHLPPGYGEIFDVTLSAIQGPGSGGGGSQQTINIKPYGSYGSGGGGQQQQGDIIVSASGDDGFVSIDGKRTYINLFGDPTDPPAGAQLPTTPATAIPQLPGGGSGSSTTDGTAVSGVGNAVTQHPLPNLGAVGYGVPESEVIELKPTKAQSPNPPVAPPQLPSTTNAGPATRPHYRQRTTQPPVRIDTCIVGDDSTCDQAQHERCKTENGVSSCHCRPGYSRRKAREPCRKVISFHLGLRVDRIYEHRIVWDNKLMDYNSEPYGQLSYESIRAIDSAMSMTPYSDEFLTARVNNIYRGDPNLGGSGVFVNLTIKLDESVETLRPNLRSDVQKHLLGVLHRRNNNIGNSVLYVSSPEGAISALHDLDECQSPDLNDCHTSATCTNSWGSFRCACESGFRDPWADQPQRAGRDCQSCPDAYCNNRGTCSYNDEGTQVCACDSSHYGGQCEIDGEVLGVAIGASVAAVIIIVLTLVCLIMWSRRWQREQKNAMGSPVFGYMNTAPLKSAAAGLGQPGYQVTLEDRMRWAQIADVMAQTNHYGAEPIGPTRPSSAMFAYPNLQAMGIAGTLGGMSMQSTMQMQHHQHQHQQGGLAPPVPLPRRLGLGSRSNGMRTLENSSSSEEEDRTDLLGRNFQVPRPKSRSNGSIANQSGIYYDVDYEPSGNGIGNTSVDHLYGSQNQSSSHSHVGNIGNHNLNHNHNSNNSHNHIPMSTYTSGRAPSSYYMK